MTETHLSKIEKLIGKKFPLLFRDFILRNYVSNARNYLVAESEDEGPSYFLSLLDFDTLEDKPGHYGEYDSIVSENIAFNNRENRQSLPNGIQITRTKWGDPLACLYLFEDENKEVGEAIYHSFEFSTPEYKASSIHRFGITSIKPVPAEIVAYLEERIGAEIPEKFKKYLLTGQIFSYDYFTIGQIQFQTKNEVDEFLHFCQMMKEDYSLDGLPIIIASDGIGDHLALYVESNKISNYIYKMEHEYGTFTRFRNLNDGF